jgi:hypothetical protein
MPSPLDQPEVLARVLLGRSGPPKLLCADARDVYDSGVGVPQHQPDALQVIHDAGDLIAVFPHHLRDGGQGYEVIPVGCDSSPPSRYA